MGKKLFAVPTVNGKLSAHFGRCEKFAVVEVENNEIVREVFLTPPEHQPGTYPRFLANEGVTTIIAGGMGPKALDIFAQNNIEVFVGAGTDEPQKLVENYLTNKLETSDNLCEHE